MGIELGSPVSFQVPGDVNVAVCNHLRHAFIWTSHYSAPGLTVASFLMEGRLLTTCELHKRPHKRMEIMELTDIPKFRRRVGSHYAILVEHHGARNVGSFEELCMFCINNRVRY